MSVKLEKTGKEILLDALRKALHDARFSLRCHEDQLPQAEKELAARKEEYERYVGFPAEVRSWIDKDREKIQGIEQAIAAVESMNDPARS